MGRQRRGWSAAYLSLSRSIVRARARTGEAVQGWENVHGAVVAVVAVVASQALPAVGPWRWPRVWRAARACGGVSAASCVAHLPVLDSSWSSIPMRRNLRFRSTTGVIEATPSFGTRALWRLQVCIETGSQGTTRHTTARGGEPPFLLPLL